MDGWVGVCAYRYHYYGIHSFVHIFSNSNISMMVNFYLLGLISEAEEAV